MHDYNLYKLTVLQKVYVKWERKGKEIVIKILITDNQVTLLLHDRTLSRKLFNNVDVKCGFRFGTSNGIYRLNTLWAIC